MAVNATAGIAPAVPHAWEVEAEQSRYAQVLQWGTRAGLLVLILSFVVYAAGWLPGRVSPDRLPQLWELPVADFVHATATPIGLDWMGFLYQGDMLGVFGIALLAGASVPCLAAVVPLYAAKADRTYAVLCTLQIAVLVLVASGMLTTGH